ncbi:MAG: hypothetical protein AAF591_23055 [Verrucomicrobiota bacterium]
MKKIAAIFLGFFSLAVVCAQDSKVEEELLVELEKLSIKDLGAAINRSKEIEDEDLREGAIYASIRSASRSEVMAFVDQGKIQAWVAATALVDGCPESELEEFGKWLLALEPTTKRKYVLRKHARKWASLDLKSAEDWISKIDCKSFLLKGVASDRRFFSKNHLPALRMLSKIEDQDSRKLAGYSILRSFYLKDKEGAKKWIKAHPNFFSPEALSHLAEVFQRIDSFESSTRDE